MASRPALFCCDATPELGGGHIMHCLTLANAMARVGYDVRSATAQGSATAVPALARSGFDLNDLAEPLDPAQLLVQLHKSVDVLADIPQMTFEFVEILPLSNHQGNCIPSAAIR